MEMYDVLIIGSGIAGLSTAISAAEEGLSVCILSKASELKESNTFYAQGGIVVEGENDSPELLEEDILAAGNRINRRKAVSLLSEEGPKVVKEFLIDKIKVPFYRDEKGILDKTREAAHSVRRILHVKDETGKAIEESLLDYAHNMQKIDFVNLHTAVDIITNSHNSRDPQEMYKEARALGVYALDQKTGEVKKMFAPAVVLATGGVGNLFLHTSNPRGAMGDGIAMAYRTGAEIVNAEYVQFHPTILFHRDIKRFLITESLRGEGARLINRQGDYFMKKYNPELQDLAPRDEVARAIYHEMELDGSEYVFLDTRRIKAVSLEDRFPGIYSKCKSVGIDITKDPIPVVPAAHYFCGGVKVNLVSKTSIKGLYAVGETACTGVHGANRLASVSLLEGLFFGVRLGHHLKYHVKQLSKSLLSTIPDWIYPTNEEEFDPVLIYHDLLNIQMTMWNYVGIIRTKKRLSRAQSDLNYMSHRIEQFYKTARLTREIIELRNAVLTSALIAKAAIANPVSIGCHYLRG
ncbi:MAG: L-aspartate oxidase [Spirochaetota bacterium]